MRKHILSVSVIALGIAISAFVVGFSYAQTPEAGAAIAFPVAELGNCGSKDECKKYCNEPGNQEACIAFAERNGLMRKEEAAAAKKFIASGSKGPGGCTGKEECEAYCDDISRIDECVTFAERTGMLPAGELDEAKKVQSAIKKGVKPPACRNKKECDAFCDDPQNMESCIAFGEAAGFLAGKELEDAKKMIQAVKKGATPPPCRGKEACDAYCAAPEHIEACMAFASAAGFMTEEEAANSQKMIQAIKKGAKPPACRGKEECDSYCADSSHVEECANFAVAAGFMTEENAAMARKTGGKGPGGCTGRDACEAFCGNPENQETCFNFGKENGLIKPEDLQKMEEGKQRMQESFRNMPPEVSDCLSTSLGSGAFEKFKSGQAAPTGDMSQKIGECFSKMGRPPEGGENGQSPRPFNEGDRPMGPPPEGENGIRPGDERRPERTNERVFDPKNMPEGIPQIIRDSFNGPMDATRAEEFERMKAQYPQGFEGAPREGQFQMPPQGGAGSTMTGEFRGEGGAVPQFIPQTFQQMQQPPQMPQNQFAPPPQEFQQLPPPPEGTPPPPPAGFSGRNFFGAIMEVMRPILGL